jgi:hypothetical protein
MDLPTSLPSRPSLRRPGLLIVALLTCGVLLVLGAAVGAGAATSARSKHHAATVSGASFQTGVGDEQTEMFVDPLWQQLHTKIARYITPYDTAANIKTLTACGRRATCEAAAHWIVHATEMHQQILVAFYYSERTSTTLPSLTIYQRDVQSFMKLFPQVRQYQPWNEANRGTVRYRGNNFNSPSAATAAKYYQVLRRTCLGCTVVGLDILDQPNVGPSLSYIAEFKSAIGRLRTTMPSIWGLHNYSDTNRFESSRTRAILAAVPGQVWLTETGGIVKFGGAFPNNHGSGLSRAASALSNTFKLASTNRRITRLYIYQWSGATEAARFDAGLTDYRHRPRPGYLVVCQHLHAAHCRVKVSRR